MAGRPRQPPIAMLCVLACVVVVDGSVSAQRGDRAAPSCPLGQTVTSDTAGHCCFAGQSWSTSRSECVGTPTCPPTFAVSGTTCACEGGLAISPDTQGHCCWTGQAWSSVRGRCVGAPMSCPPSYVAVGEDCAPVPSCPDGRIAVTTGQCCWAGQSWDETGQRCHGRPASCPSGRVARGADCAPTLEAAGGRVQSILSGLAYRFETRGDASSGVTTTTGHYELDAPACLLRFADVQDLSASSDPGTHTEVRRTLLLRLNIAARLAAQSAGPEGGAIVVTAPGSIESGGHRTLVTAQTLPVGTHRDELIDALADLARACGAHPHVSH